MLPRAFDIQQYAIDVGAYVHAFEALRETRASVGVAPVGAAFVSLGQNCSTAWYLKASGKRSCSTPFDWIFSSPQIVEDCIRGDFRDFLDPRFVVPVDETCAGHTRYHRRLFNHRNPLVGANHAYYERCVARFRALYASARPIVFVSTALPEHAARPAWSEGFVCEFAAPANVDPLAEYASLSALLEERAAPTRLVVLQQRTCQERPRFELIGHDDELSAFAFDVCGASTGVYYLNALDEALARAVYGTLCA